MPPQRCIDLAAQAEIIVASPLPRALASLEKPGLRATYSDVIFREVALPLATPAVAPTLWLSLLRLLWLCGYFGSVESFRHARQRARLAASQRLNEIHRPLPPADAPDFSSAPRPARPLLPAKRCDG